jgi:hypothetical protein
VLYWTWLEIRTLASLLCCDRLLIGKVANFLPISRLPRRQPRRIIRFHDDCAVILGVYEAVLKSVAFIDITVDTVLGINKYTTELSRSRTYLTFPLEKVIWHFYLAVLQKGHTL